MSASLDKLASGADAGWGHCDSQAEAPANERPTRQVGETDIGFARKPL
jgi:hypothetical protein